MLVVEKANLHVLWIGQVLLGDLMIQIAMTVPRQAYELRALGAPHFSLLARHEGI